MNLEISCFMSLIRAIYAVTLLILTSSAWFLVISRYSGRKCTKRAFWLYLGGVSKFYASKPMELRLRICLQLDQHQRALDKALGVVVLLLAIYAMIGDIHDRIPHLLLSH
ncbi:hypothetical protein E3P94_04146 [Wallemia ichthyophaga]|nr:hypothetical protein E3P95_04145 [Wallemia ichthyophaga]TIA95050.1 hypothetical protein E3P94_04146 [Wallemia ichthyophaga]